jgi:acyl-coenzyme A thioesterase PaaI-like protein
VDFLRSGIGEHFIGRAEVTRLGGRIASTQMRLENEQRTLIATAAASFVVS